MKSKVILGNLCEKRHNTSPQTFQFCSLGPFVLAASLSIYILNLLTTVILKNTDRVTKHRFQVTKQSCSHLLVKQSLFLLE